MKKLFRKELLIGVLVLTALAILIFGIDFLKGANVFQPTNYYYATYTDVNGLAVSAPVTVNGYKIGQVRDIQYQYDNPGHVRVEIALDKDMKLPKGTVAQLTTDMLGTSSIALVLAPGKDFYASGDELVVEQPKGMMASLSEEVLPGVATIIPHVDSLLVTVTNLAGDPALRQSIQRLDAITANLEQSTVQLNNTLRQMGPIAGDVKQVTGNFVTTSDNLNAFSATMRGLPVDSLMVQVQSTLDNLNELSRQLNNPNSTLGRLSNDPALYNNLNSTVQSLDSLFTDIKANPKRYINIKVF